MEFGESVYTVLPVRPHDLTAATELYVSVTNRAGNDVGGFLSNINLSDSVRKGTLIITRSGGNAQVAYDVMGAEDATGYVKVLVANGVGATGFLQNDAISFQFSIAGDRGTNGDGAGDFIGPDIAVQDNLVAFDGTSGKIGKDSGFKASEMVKTSQNGADFNNKRATLDNLTLKGADIASASTINLDTATGHFINVTGTTATSAITLASGKSRLVRASGAWSITVGANLVLSNGGGNYICSAGDMILFIADGVVVRGLIFPAAGSVPGDGSVTNAKLENMAPATIKGRAAASGTGAPVDLSAAQVWALLGAAPVANAFSRSTVVGSVSQASGVPTGAVIERGSNANGEYVRFADGTQFCWGTFSTTGGSVVFPASFASAPTVVGSHNGGVAQSRFASFFSITTSGCNVQAFQSETGSTTTFIVGWVGYGRWF